MKLRLDVDELNDDFFEETRILGITATLKNYQFCMQLNTNLGYDFRLNPELEILIRRKDRSYYFSIYQFKEFNSPLTHFCIKINLMESIYCLNLSIWTFYG